MILSCEMPAGAQLRASTLAQDWGWGLTPIREALTRLHSERLVKTTFNSGFAVVGMSAKGLLDLASSRALIETEMLRNSIDLGTEDWEGRIVAAFYQFNRVETPTLTMDNAGLSRWEERHRKFHAALISECPSEWLHHMNNQVDAHMQFYQRNILSELRKHASVDLEMRDNVDQLLVENMCPDSHSALMGAVLDRNKKEATKLFQSHSVLSLRCYTELQELAASLVND
jgi:DNA-binding GntR family transcriptional regulator